MYIRVNDPSLKRNIGKYQLSYLWYELWFNTKYIQLKYTYHTRCSLCMVYPL